MVPRAGLEPARSCLRGILNPLCLPIPPPGLGIIIMDKQHKALFIYQISYY